MTDIGVVPGQGADPWAIVREVAARPRNTHDWLQDLADAIETAVRPDAAGVFLCTLGNMLEATFAVAPREHAALGEALVREHLPYLYHLGIDSPWDLFTPEPHLVEPASQAPLRMKQLAPAGFAGMTGAFLRSADGMTAGWITVFTRSAGDQRRLQIAAPLVTVSHVIEAVIQSSIDIASALGARFPKISPYSLSDREVEVARLAANGFSDLNIAKALSISEGTVGRHLHNIFRKLGIGSRIELSDVLCQAV